MFDYTDVQQLGVNEQIDDTMDRRDPGLLITEKVRKVTSHILNPMTEFRTRGYMRLGHMIDHRNVLEFLDTKPVYKSHVASYSSGSPAEDTSQNGIYCWQMSDLLECPAITSLITNPLITTFVSQYFKCYPTFYSANCMWTKGNADHCTWQRHRDTDDFKFVTLFIYLTDVDETNGAHIYEEGTHGVVGHPNDVSGPEIVLTGNAGEGFITDSWGVHRGGTVQPGKERKILWLRYGLYDNCICRKTDKNIAGIKRDVTDFNSYVTRFI